MRPAPRAPWCAVLALAAGACEVADKQPAAPDAHLGDAGGDVPADTRAPDTIIEGGPPAFSNTGQATFRFSSDDPGATFACRIDREAARPCRSPYARPLPDGPHSFSVRASDAAGNRDGTPAERVWTIDTVAPDTLLTGEPLAIDNSVAVPFAFRASEASAAFDCALDSADYLPCASGASFGPVGNGPHSFAVRARDRAGNVDASPAVYAWRVDTRTPDTQILGGPSGATASTSASFTFSSPDAGLGARFRCALDGEALTACRSPWTYTGLVEGPHTFAVQVRDFIGRVDPSPAVRRWTVDLTPPDTVLIDGPSGTVPVASASFTFTASEPDATFACSLDGGAFAPCTSPGAVTGLTQGAHAFSVRATDAAGHPDPSPASRSWTVDTAVPEVAIAAHREAAALARDGPP